MYHSMFYAFVIILFQDRPDAHHLTCQYKRHHPMFYINPLREETMNFKPWIVVYHNLLYDDEIEMIKKTATPLVSSPPC